MMEFDKDEEMLKKEVFVVFVNFWMGYGGVLKFENKFCFFCSKIFDVNVGDFF